MTVTRQEKSHIRIRTFMSRLLSAALCCTLLSTGMPAGVRAESPAVSAEPAIASADAATVSGGYLMNERFLYTYTGTNTTDCKPSGWDTDITGGRMENGYGKWFKMVDTSTGYEVTMKKQFARQSAGKVTLEMRLKLSANMENAGISLMDGQSAMLNLHTSGGQLICQTPGASQTLQSVTPGTAYGIKVTCDLDAGTADIAIHGVLRGSQVPLGVTAPALNTIRLNTGITTQGEMFIAPIMIYRGFAVHEQFVGVPSGAVPGDWSLTGTGGSAAVTETAFSLDPEVSSLKLDDTSTTGNLILARTFGTTAGGQDFRFKFMEPVLAGGMHAELKSAGQPVLKISTLDGQLTCTGAGGLSVPLQGYQQNLWYDVRVQMTPEAGTADVYVNGKKRAAGVSLTPVSGLNQLTFSTGVSQTGTLWLDDIALEDRAPEPQDYVPVPQKTVSSDYLVGMESCSIWNEGQHIGWDRINPYPDRKPYLGFYDEGNPEVADWETKWLVEHGVDFQFYLWYNNGNQNPIKDPMAVRNSIHDGYFYSRYSDMMQFAIQYEGFTSSADFRNNIVPYWMEYYFKDSRYLVVNNKPVIGFLRYQDLLGKLGTKAAVKTELDYLRSQCIANGFAGATILTIYEGADTSQMAELKEAGFDAIYAYSWGGYPERQKSKLLAQRDAGAVDVIPTFSVGRDDRAWYPMAEPGRYTTPDEFKSVLEWGRDAYMPTLPQNSPGKSMVLLDNWNEYGEGHFIMPSGLHGFDYLDGIRSTFAGSAPAHTDQMPAAGQRARINRMYDDSRTLPMPQVAERPVGTQFLTRWDFNTDGDTEGWRTGNQVSDLTVTDGKLNGTATGGDPQLISADNLGIDTQNAPYIKIGYRNKSSDVKAELFFTTNISTSYTWDKSRSVSLVPNDGVYTEYIFQMWRNVQWQGVLKQLRLDPLEQAGDFSIDYIGILQRDASDIGVAVDGSSVTLYQMPVMDNDKVLIPLEPVMKKAGAITLWNADTGTLTIDQGGVLTTLTAGNAVALQGGQPVTMDHAAILSNGALMVSYTAVKTLFGFNASWDDTNRMVSYYTGPLVFGFDTTAGWSSNSLISGLKTSEGRLTGTSAGADGAGQEPLLISPDKLGMEASSVKRVRVNMQNLTPGTSIRMDYRTSLDPQWSSEKSLTAWVVPGDTTEHEVVFDCTGVQAWAGIIQQIRLMPSAAPGSFRIDSVKLDTETTLPVRGANLFTDPGMEGTSLSNASWGATPALTTEAAYSGMQSMKITKTAATGMVKFAAPLVNHQSYYVAFRNKLAPGATNGEVLRVCLEYKLDGVTKQKLLFTGPSLNTTDWKLTEGTFRLDETGTVTHMVVFVYTDTPAATDSYYLDDAELRPVSVQPGPAWTPVTGVSLNQSSAVMLAGDRLSLGVIVSPAGASNTGVVWSSDHPEIAGVDMQGNVFGKVPGEANITVISADNGMTGTCHVVVKQRVSVQSVSINPAEITLPLGLSENIQAVLAPADASDQTVNWSSDNTAVAVVDAAGKVTAVSPGQTTLRVTSRDGAKTAAATVTVPSNMILGTNGFADPGIEGALPAFGIWGGSLALATQPVHGGQQSLKVTKTASTGAVYFTAASGVIQNQVPFRFSAWVRRDAASTATGTLKVWVQYKVNGIAQTPKNILNSGLLSTTAWKEVSGVWTIQETGTVSEIKVYVYTDTGSVANDMYYLDDLAIQNVLGYAGTVSFYSDKWREFGTMDQGFVRRELLPGQYPIRMKYQGIQKDQNVLINSNQTVVFTY